ncbi:MAG: magnesium transporter CorA family protein [Clostridia bacterium]|nr:magnesium transporter CorA family protein [Clostridia bacterium]
MIKFYHSIHGAIHEIPQNEPGCWINVCAPDEAELDWLITNLEIPHEFLAAALDEEESSHIEAEDNKKLIIVDIPFSQKVDDDIRYYTIPIGIILTENNIITVSIKENTVIKDFTDGKIKNINTAYKTKFVFQILLHATARYLNHLKLIDKRTTELEMNLRRSMRNKELTGMLDYEKSLVYFQTSLKSNELTLQKITKNNFIKMYEEDQELLEDVMIEIKQALEMCNIHLSILSGTMDAFASIISNNLNIVMKILTSLTIVMAIPTMVFSFYGMNIGEFAGALPGAQTVVVPLVVAFAIAIIATIVLIAKGMFK